MEQFYDRDGGSLALHVGHRVDEKMLPYDGKGGLSHSSPSIAIPGPHKRNSRRPLGHTQPQKLEQDSKNKNRPPVSTELHIRAARTPRPLVSIIGCTVGITTHFFMIIHRSAFPIVCDSSNIWNVAAERSGSAPFIWGPVLFEHDGGKASVNKT